MAFQMEAAWLHGRMLCIQKADEGRRLEAPQRAQGLLHPKGLSPLYILWLLSREKCSGDFWEKRISSVEDILCSCRSCRCQQ